MLSAFADGADDWRVWLEPKFMRPPASAAIPSAERTLLTAGRLERGALEPWTKAEWTQLNLTWEDFFTQARAQSATDLAALKPTYVRNRKNIIEYAELRAKDDTVASAVLAPTFAALFAETLGPELLIVVPNRSVAYVFPKLASNYRDYAPMVLRGYRETSHPVSLEVFELSADGLRAIGAYADPARDPMR